MPKKKLDADKKPEPKKKPVILSNTVFSLLSDSVPLAETTEWMTTGMPAVDDLLSKGKGVPFGKIIEVYGKEASGKTAFCQYLIGCVQRMGGYGFYIDFEASYNSEHIACYGIDKSRLFYYAPETAEKAFESIFQTLAECQKISPFVIVIDSVAAMVAEAEKKDDAVVQIAGVSRVLSRLLRKLVVRVSGKRGFIIFTNQVRDKINSTPFGEKTVRPGGHALDFYATIILNTYVKNTLKRTVNKKAVNTGFVIAMTSKKNRLGIPKETAEFILSFDRGVDPVWTLFNFLLDKDIIKTRGKFVIYNEQEYSKDDLLDEMYKDIEKFYALCVTKK